MKASSELLIFEPAGQNIQTSWSEYSNQLVRIFKPGFNAEYSIFKPAGQNIQTSWSEYYSNQLITNIQASCSKYSNHIARIFQPIGPNIPNII
jgi:hypothetical protein